MHFLRAQNINSFDLQIRMYIVVFINSWHFYQNFSFFFSWKLSVGSPAPLLAPTSHLSWKCPFLYTPGYRKTARIFTALDCWAVAQGHAGEKRPQSTWQKCIPERPPFSWADHPQPFTCSHKVCQTQRVCALTTVCSSSFIYRILYVIFHVISLSDFWQEHGRHGKDQCKLSSTSPLT